MIKLRRVTPRNQWVLCNREVNSLSFYCPKEKKVIGRSDMPAYLPTSGDKYCNISADEVLQITEVTNRHKESTGMRHGGHFMLGNTLYLDLSAFCHPVLEEKVVYENAGSVGKVWGLNLTYSIPHPSAHAQIEITRFFYHRDDIVNVETPEAAKLDALCALYNSKVVDHRNRDMSRSMAQRMLANRADFIALLSSP